MERVVGIEPTSPAWKAGVIAFIRYPQAIDFSHNCRVLRILDQCLMTVITTLPQPGLLPDRAQTIS
jgi:hypothetical protein